MEGLGRWGNSEGRAGKVWGRGRAVPQRKVWRGVGIDDGGIAGTRSGGGGEFRKSGEGKGA